MLGSPIATIEGGIDVVTNVRRVYDQYTRKAGGIDILKVSVRSWI